MDTNEEASKLPLCKQPYEVPEALQAGLPRMHIMECMTRVGSGPVILCIRKCTIMYNEL